MGAGGGQRDRQIEIQRGPEASEKAFRNSRLSTSSCPIAIEAVQHNPT
jgi:hypothetical protein